MGRGRNSDWFWRTVATARPSTGRRDETGTWVPSPTALTSAEWVASLKAAGIDENGLTYGRWDEQGAWLRGDPKVNKEGTGKRKQPQGDTRTPALAEPDATRASSMASTVRVLSGIGQASSGCPVWLSFVAACV